MGSHNSTTLEAMNLWVYCLVCQVAVRLGQKIRETVKGKLNLGAKILQVGGLRKVYKQLFSVREGEKLLKACQCHLSTTTGPLAGLLFISTHKLAFCSDKSLKLSSPTGELLRFHYKVTTYLSLRSTICLREKHILIRSPLIWLYAGLTAAPSLQGDTVRWVVCLGISSLKDQLIISKVMFEKGTNPS